MRDHQRTPLRSRALRQQDGKHQYERTVVEYLARWRQHQFRRTTGSNDFGAVTNNSFSQNGNRRSEARLTHNRLPAPPFLPSLANSSPLNGSSPQNAPRTPHTP